jgi:hypothetical protein
MEITSHQFGTWFALVNAGVVDWPGCFAHGEKGAVLPSGTSLKAKI